MMKAEWKKKLLPVVPYAVVALLCSNFGESFRLAGGNTCAKKLQVIFSEELILKAFANGIVSFHLKDLLVGIVFASAFRLFVFMKGMDKKKFRPGEEYGSARSFNLRRRASSSP